MPGKSSVAAAVALVLVIAGGASALVAAEAPPPALSRTTAISEEVSEPIVVIEYVDEDGNPVAAPGSQPTIELRTSSSDREFIIESDVEPEVIWIDIPVAVAASFAPQSTIATGLGQCEHDDDDDECDDDESEGREDHDEDHDKGHDEGHDKGHDEDHDEDGKDDD